MDIEQALELAEEYRGDLAHGTNQSATAEAFVLLADLYRSEKSAYKCATVRRTGAQQGKDVFSRLLTAARAAHSKLYKW